MSPVITSTPMAIEGINVRTAASKSTNIVASFDEDLADIGTRQSGGTGDKYGLAHRADGSVASVNAVST